MHNTFKNDGARLLRDVVPADCVGGWEIATEAGADLFAQCHDGRVFKRAVAKNEREFDGPGWEQADAIPAGAAWIGNYKPANLPAS